MKSWKSRKFIVFVVALALASLNAWLGNPISESQIESLATLVVGWLVAQGIADTGGVIAAQPIAQRPLVENRDVAKAGTLAE
jgi:hypothetical protein